MMMKRRSTKKKKRKRRRRRSRVMGITCRHCFSAILFVLLCFSIVHADGSIIVSDAWITEAPPNARVIAGYMTIENNSSRPRTLIGVSGEKFKRIEMHRTEMDGDVMRMVPQEKLEIPSGAAVSLQPGSYHLMLKGPESVPKGGEVVNLKLHFDNGDILHIKATVRAAKR
jgi:copper(I)-binding protein